MKAPLGQSVIGIVHSLGGGMYRVSERLARAVRTRWFPDRIRPPLYDGGVLDDLLFAQPLNLLPRLALLLGRHRRVRSEGVSVIIVNHNTRDALQVVVGAVRRFSPPSTQIVVVDNASRDGSREWLASRPYGVRPVLLPTNLGHGRGLDIGIAVANSPIVITLDSDAFPYSSHWLDVLSEPLANPNSWAVGWRGPRDRLHPACSAVRRQDFLDRRLSYAVYNLHLDLGDPPVFGVNTWDAGELIFARQGVAGTHLIEPIATAFGGGTMADVVYHHCGLTTLMEPGNERDPVVVRAEWSLAVGHFLSAHRQ